MDVPVDGVEGVVGDEAGVERGLACLPLLNVLA
jgi:hypothetical protein